MKCDRKSLLFNILHPFSIFFIPQSLHRITLGLLMTVSISTSFSMIIWSTENHTIINEWFTKLIRFLQFPIAFFLPNSLPGWQVPPTCLAVTPHVRAMHWLHDPTTSELSRGPISQRIYELMIQILSKFMLYLFENWSSDQVIILHMSWQLSCHDMCKIMTWLDYQNHDYSKENFQKIFILSSKNCCKMCLRLSAVTPITGTEH